MVTNVDNSTELANTLFDQLTAGITIPAVPTLDDPKFNFDPDTTSLLYQDITATAIEDITTGCLEGDGSFDKMMEAVDLHLQREYKGNRITGSQYAEVYVSVINSVLSNATSFALQKDQAKWTAIRAQMEARIAEIQATEALINLERTKLSAAKEGFEMNLTAANYAQTKMQTAVLEANHDEATATAAQREYELKHLLPAERAIKEYERTAVMPSTVAMNDLQVDRILPAQAAISEFQHREMLPIEKAIAEIRRDVIVQKEGEELTFRVDQMLPLEYTQAQHVTQIRQPRETELIEEQIEVQRAQTLDIRRDGLTPVSGVIGLQKENLQVDHDTKDYTLLNQLPKQVELIGKQIDLTGEQRESERAKTLDARSDGQNVLGSVGKQKDLYTQQIDSFIKDAQHKTAKMYLDAWITQKTLDEGLNAPTQLTNNEINEVMAGVRLNNNLGS